MGDIIDIQELKQSIINEEKIELILQELNMHHIQDRGDYYSCGMPDGDRPNSTVIYKDSLHVDAYTRSIEDKYGSSDIISLVSYINKTYLSHSIKWICEICGFNYYGESEQIPELTKWIMEMSKPLKTSDDEIEYLKPLNKDVLKYFGKYSNELFKKDGISSQTMIEFELGYDLKTHRITIPIRDEIGTLVGVKGRLFKEVVDDWEQKYIYLFPCAKSKILYGLDKTYGYIKKFGEVIVVESEKGVLQLWSNGIRNAVAIGGHKLSKSQVQKLTHLNVDIVLAFDEGADIGENGEIDKTYYKKEFNKFLPQQSIYCIYDKDKNILNSKKSPTDDMKKWEILYLNKFKVR